ncbi:hypothetical protein AAC03nite_36030 [Alicyclobacillus acidoterrestris]|nr:hypothetical protein AAC03nite_36030 [Alicyclobacillus acidoterrestris]
MRYPRMYREIFTNLQKLEWNLQETERKRADLERLRKEWTAGITHDLKTPLSVISGYANMLLSPDHTWEDGERDEFVRIIREKANHMEELIADLNIAFKLDTAPDIPLNPERIDLVELLRRTVADAMNIPSQPTDTWEFHAPEKAVYIMADVKLLQRALLNVLTNAVLHNPSGTKIEVFLQTKLEHAEIKIRDNGAGMDEWTVLHLFDRYYRGTSTELPTIGTGLGMAIAKQLITSHGGTIHVRSSVGEGTSVLIRLPVLLEL